MQTSCATHELDGIWLKNLGFTYKIQSTPFTNAAKKVIPVGGEVVIFCEDVTKRPTKDIWDTDATDGLISGYCSFSGEFSVPLQPEGTGLLYWGQPLIAFLTLESRSDWERCRKLCPVAKPEPPAVPGAQLIPLDDTLWESEVWEGDTIQFRCENSSLVIDNQSGVRTVAYPCLPDGTYGAPQKPEKWPRCTVKPTDQRECSSKFCWIL